MFQKKCVECGKWLDSDEYSYGHDCEGLDDFVDPNPPVSLRKLLETIFEGS